MTSLSGESDNGIFSISLKPPEMFITFEGIEGCGKTTLMGALAQRLGIAGNDVVLAREPGGTPAGDRIRALFLAPETRLSPLGEVLLLNASRAELVRDVIHPALQRGATVLCDRFVDSTLAYQAFGRGLSSDMIRSVNAIATGNLLPTLTFLLDVPVSVSRERVGRRLQTEGAETDRLESEDDAFHERVRAGFLELAEHDSRFVVLDGTLPPETLLERAAQRVNGVRR